MIDFAAGGVCPERIPLPAFVGTGRVASDGFNCDTPVGSPIMAYIHNDYFAVAPVPGRKRLLIQFEAAQIECNNSRDFS